MPIRGFDSGFWCRNLEVVSWSQTHFKQGTQAFFGTSQHVPPEHNPSLVVQLSNNTLGHSGHQNLAVGYFMKQTRKAQLRSENTEIISTAPKWKFNTEGGKKKTHAKPYLHRLQHHLHHFFICLWSNGLQRPKRIALEKHLKALLLVSPWYKYSRGETSVRKYFLAS